MRKRAEHEAWENKLLLFYRQNAPIPAETPSGFKRSTTDGVGSSGGGVGVGVAPKPNLNNYSSAANDLSRADSKSKKKFRLKSPRGHKSSVSNPGTTNIKR